MTEPTESLPEHLFRHAAGRIVATLTRLVGPARLDLAEEVVQEALVAAVEAWPYQGVPRNPAGWLYAVARHRALDRLRREAVLRRKIAALGPLVPEPAPGRPGQHDDQLAMIFLCCHPALSRAGRVALTLKAVGGFSVDEIAATLLTRPAAIAQQLVRAKRRIRACGLRFELPASRDLAERLDSVLEVLYLLFTEGYQAHQGDRLTRAPLCEEAVRLSRLLLESPATRRPAVHALLALMLLQGSRLPARTDAAGEVLRLDEQDRARWSRGAIREGFEHLEHAAAGNRITAYHLEAAIAACHASTVDGGATDWPRVLELYDELLVIKPSPVVALNRALALAMVQGPRAGIRALGRLTRHRALRGYHLLPAALGALWQRAGDQARAARCYRMAERQAASAPTRRFLAAQAARLRPVASGRRRHDGVRRMIRAAARGGTSPSRTPSAGTSAPCRSRSAGSGRRSPRTSAP